MASKNHKRKECNDDLQEYAVGDRRLRGIKNQTGPASGSPGATVIDVQNGVLEVMSTILVPFQHGGKFTEDEVEQIVVVYPADVAIPQESRGKGFSKNQRVSVVVRDGGRHEGEVVAAFDGVVVARKSDGQLITGGASHFKALV